MKGTIAKAPETPDGKVAALNEGTFNVLQEIKRKNPGSLTLEDALALRNAIIHDDQIDAEEADLLSEMTQHNFRNITVTKAGKTEPPARVMTFPTVTQANTVLRETLNPQLNLETSWTAGAQGWRDIIQESGVSSEQAQRVAAFLQSRVAEAWQASTPSNAWKPFRDLIAQRYGLTKTSGLPAERMEQARKLMMDACRATNDKSHNQIPGHLYEWWKPAPPP